MNLSLAGVLYDTFANGPGRRALVSLRGCSIRCPGCINEHLWDPGELDTDPAELAATLVMWFKETYRQYKETPGLTVSGGEPADQIDGLVCLLRRTKEWFSDTILFSGHTRNWWNAKHPGVLDDLVDAAILGPYLKDQPATQGLFGSTNQVIWINPDGQLHQRKVELETFKHITEIHPNGIITGFPPTEEKPCQHL